MINPATPEPELASVVWGFCILISPFAAAGMILTNTGLVRSRNAAHAMMAALCVFAVAAIVYCAFGFSFEGSAGLPSRSISLGGKAWDWIAAGNVFLAGVTGPNQWLVVWLGMSGCIMAAMIPLGASGERWRLGSSCASTAVLTSCVYPLFAHWAWGGGWLAQLDVMLGLRRGFLDPGGAGVIHVVGGLTALSITWILGPRRGKFNSDGMPMAIPGHNTVFVLFGCLLSLIGWVGLNAAGAILFAQVEIGRVPVIAVNTILSAASSTIAAALLTRARFGKPDPSLTANGWVGGLVVSSAVAPFATPMAAMLVGAIGGLLVPLSVEWLELKLGIDDPAGAVSVHAIEGVWGLLALSFFAGNWLPQLIGVATLMGFVFPLSYGLNWLLNRVLPMRAPVDGERIGMDLYELGANAYPEEVIRLDDFGQR